MSISIWNYGNYSSDNYGSSRAVNIGDLTLYFSYKTVVAFSYKGEETIMKNYWNVVTGRHLNCIDDNHKIRIDRNEFDIKLNKLLKKLKLD